MQTTIAKNHFVSGIGIHSGEKVIMELMPAKENHGIVFRTKDGDEIKAKFDNVHTTTMSTRLSNENCSIDVVEHLMAALWALGIDNILIKLDKAEVPISDGSAIDWIKQIKEAGITQKKAQRKILILKKTLEIHDDDKYVIMSPNEKPGITIDLSIDFEHPAIGRQRILFDSTRHSFEEEFAPARTFGFMKDLDYLHSKGIGLGASLENCIALDDTGIVNREGLRFNDEFVRHKVLDCVGDLFLSGYHLNCKVRAHKTGHKMNNLALRRLFEDHSNYLIS